jgi:triphosphoribosyl-dephospho-CoA synthase
MQSEPYSNPNFNLASDQAQDRAEQLANLAVRALIAEIELTPKPGLVDARGSGAHTDLSPALMRHSARTLRRTFERMALVSFHQAPSRTLREELGVTGRSAERSMLLDTGGVNTHRGAIWALGLLVSAAAMGSNSPKVVASWAARLARISDRNVPVQESNGLKVVRRFNVAGARGEALAGFPQCGAVAVLAAGGTRTVRGWKLLHRLELDLAALNASPGGSADLLAATLFLDFLLLARLQKGHHGKA